MTADAINEHALALSEVTRFEDDAIVAASALMLTFTKVGSDIFPDATDATLDMAQAMGMDLQSATMLVGKALNDPVKGMTALTRSGIQFTEAQKEAVAAMVAMGDTAGAQQIILKELEVQFGGSAEAAGKTLSGQMEILKNQFGNVKEEIGGALIPALAQMASWIGPILVRGFESFGQLLTNTIIPAISKVVKVISSVFVGIFEDGWNVADLIGYLSTQFPALGGIMDKFKSAGEGVSGFLATFKETLVNVGTAIVNQVQPTIETLAAIWRDNLQPAIETLSSKLSETLLPALSRLWEWLGVVLPPVIETVGTFFREHILPALGDVATFIVGTALPAIVDLATWLLDHIPPAVEEAAKFFREHLQPPLEKIAKWLSENIPKAIEGMKAAWIDAQPTIEIIKGILEDVGEVLGTVWDWLNEKIPAAVNAAKGAFEGAASAISGIIGTIEGVISKISDAIEKLREFLNMPTTPGQSYGGTPTGRPGGATYGGTPSGPTGGGGYGSTPTRSMAGAGGLVFNITINAAGGNPQAVAVAAQTGVMAAARSMGLA